MSASLPRDVNFSESSRSGQGPSARGLFRYRHHNIVRVRQKRRMLQIGKLPDKYEQAYREAVCLFRNSQTSSPSFSAEE